MTAQSAVVLTAGQPLDERDQRAHIPIPPTGRDEATVSVWLTEHAGRLMVQAIGERCSAALRDATRAPRPCALEVADVAPLPMRSRIRARVRLQGSLLAAEPHVGLLWHFLPDQAWLDLDDATIASA
jgi:hypothetical protein